MLALQFHDLGSLLHLPTRLLCNSVDGVTTTGKDLEGA